MPLTRTRNLLTLLKERLDGEDEAGDGLLESVVVNYLLTVAYSDLEQAIRKVLSDYGTTAVNSDRVQSFIRVAVVRLVRSIKCSDLAGTLGHFAADSKTHFQVSINDTPQQAAYDRVVLGRHEQSHHLGSSMTLVDLEADLDGCQLVLDAFSAGLSCVAGSA